MEARVCVGIRLMCQHISYDITSAHVSHYRANDLKKSLTFQVQLRKEILKKYVAKYSNMSIICLNTGLLRNFILHINQSDMNTPRKYFHGLHGVAGSYIASSSGELSVTGPIFVIIDS